MRSRGPAALLVLSLATFVAIGEEISQPPKPESPEEALTLASIRALSHENAKTRAAAALRFVNFPDPRAVDGLIPLVDHKREGDVEVRVNAVRALGEIGDPKAYDPVLKAMQTDPNRQVPWVCLISIGKIRDPRGFEQLRTVLQTDERLEWRHIAAYALGYTGNKGVLDLLTVAIGSPEMKLRRDAARGLAAANDPSGCPVILGRLELETTGEAMRAMIDALLTLKCQDAIPVFERMKKKLEGKRGEFDRIDRELADGILLLQGKDPGEAPPPATPAPRS